MPTSSCVLIAAACAALALAPTFATAGDVAVSVGGGTLKVAGTAADDELTIAGFGVNAVNVTPGAATTVNGSGAPQVFGGITKGFKISLGDGADDLNITRSGRRQQRPRALHREPAEARDQVGRAER